MKLQDQHELWRDLNEAPDDSRKPGGQSVLRQRKRTEYDFLKDKRHEDSYVDRGQVDSTSGRYKSWKD